MDGEKRKKYRVMCQEDDWSFEADTEEEVLEEVDLHHAEIHDPDLEFHITWATIQ